MLKLSIIIPMYNVEPYIVQCIESLQNQGIPREDYEIIIIDDGSTDNCYQIANDLIKGVENINIYQYENAGLSVTRNRGLAKAKGNYIFFMDSDDYVADNSMLKALHCVHDNSLDILEFDWIRSVNRNLTTSKANKESSELKILSGKEYIETMWIHDSVCTSFYRRQFLIDQNARFYEGRTMEDMIFNLELIPNAKRIAHFPFDIYRYMINPNSIWTSTDAKAMRTSINDFVFMTIKFSTLRNKLNEKGIKTDILHSKIQIMLFNTFKRVLKSDLSFKETNQIIEDLKASNLYPLDAYHGKEKYRGVLTKVFNNKYLLAVARNGFRLMRKPIDVFIIQKHKKKKEKKIAVS